MSTSNELHVVFGTGPLGHAVMQVLCKRGHWVRMVNRSGKADAPAQVEVLSVDAYDPEAVRQATLGATAVYQCAQPAYHKWPTQFPSLQQSILEGVALNGAKFLVGDNLYMYGEVAGPLREDLPYAATTQKGRVRAEMAETVLGAHRQGKVRAALIRGSDFYGPRVLGSALGERTFIPMLQGKAASVTGNPDMPHTYTYIEDFGKAMVMVGEREDALGQVWFVPNAPALTQREMLAIAFQQLGKRPKISAMGKFMMRIGGLFIPEARETVEMMYEFEKPFVVDSSKFVEAFGDIATPHAEGLRRTLVWYQQHLKEAAH